MLTTGLIGFGDVSGLGGLIGFPLEPIGCKDGHMHLVAEGFHHQAQVISAVSVVVNGEYPQFLLHRRRRSCSVHTQGLF